MKMRMNHAIMVMASNLDCDYAFALGIFLMLKEMDKAGELETMSEDRFYYELGFMSRQSSQKISRIKREDLCEVYRETLREVKREDDRERQREYYKRKRSAPSSPPSPTPLSPLLSPQEKESGDNSPLHLRCRPPEGAHPQGKRFSAPSVEDVKAYAAEKGYSIEAERFVDFYASKGWLVGKSPMKDWRAAVRNWVARKDGEKGRTQLDRRPQSNPAISYKQREYSAVDDDKLFVDLDEYLKEEG